MTTLRVAIREELQMLNDRWAQVDFVASDEADLVIVAEDEGVVVGCGRLVDVGNGEKELGGMLVDAAHRGRNIGRQIVQRLVDEAGSAVIWCLPFAHVADLYQSFGFIEVNETGAPSRVIQKLAFCRRTYAQPVILLRRQ